MSNALECDRHKIALNTLLNGPLGKWIDIKWNAIYPFCLALLFFKIANIILIILMDTSFSDSHFANEDLENITKIQSTLDYYQHISFKKTTPCSSSNIDSSIVTGYICYFTVYTAPQFLGDIYILFSKIKKSIKNICKRKKQLKRRKGSKIAKLNFFHNPFFLFYLYYFTFTIITLSKNYYLFHNNLIKVKLKSLVHILYYDYF